MIEITNMFYFAYGSNMNHKQMKNRCSDSHFLNSAFLKGYKFVYDGWSKKREGAVANIIETNGKNDIVLGGLFEISENDLNKLDYYEGYPKYYTRQKFKVEDDSKSYNAIVYFRTGKEPGNPSDNYRKTVLEGARNCNLPEEYINNNLK